VLADVAGDLKAREAALDRRAGELAAREAAFGAIQARLETQLAALERYRADLAGLLGAIADADEAELAQLTKVYETMKPKQAAAVFDGLDRTTLLTLAGRMREPKLAAVLALMEPARARAVTAALAAERTPPPLRP
jgi:flagellar motility protein MotE (MotC chaperone)